MVSESVAIRQSARLSCLVSDSNGSSEWADEMVAALRKYAVNDDHCVRIADAWLADEKYRPVPSDIRKLAELVPLMKEHAKPDKACKACYGTGWEQVFTLHTYERTPDGGQYKRKEIIPTKEQADILKQTVDGVKQVVYDNVQRCTYCRYGKQTAAEEADRKAKSAGEV